MKISDLRKMTKKEILAILEYYAVNFETFLELEEWNLKLELVMFVIVDYVQPM